MDDWVDENWNTNLENLFQHDGIDADERSGWRRVRRALRVRLGLLRLPRHGRRRPDETPAPARPELDRGKHRCVAHTHTLLSRVI